MNPQLHIPYADRQACCRAHAVRELSVFGSTLRGDFGPNSNVGLPIELAPGAQVGLIALPRMRDQLVQIVGRPVDLVTKNGINRHIRADIRRDAQVVHAE